MKKGVLCFVGILLVFGLLFIFIPYIYAAEDNTPAITDNADDSEAIDLAYQCLKNQIKNRTNLNLEQAIFASLALGDESNLKGIIDKEKKSGEFCWPSKGCTLKDTGQSALSYQINNKNSKEIEKWLQSKSAISSELTWYLEIDIPSRESASCSITSDGQKRTISIGEDMLIKDNAANNCFSISLSGYWLEVKPACLDKSFDISCDKDFITSLLYERKGGDTLYVVSESHSSVSLGTTSEKIKGMCFKTGASCDYEGSLWSALALYKADLDISQYVPYLLALAESNQEFFPNAFLYILIGGEEQYSKILQLQKQAGYWELIGSKYKRYYDTSLAMLALGSGSASASEIDKPKDYLLQSRTKEGCWNQRDVIVDTAFILYSGWPRTVRGGGGGGSIPLCEEVSGQSCEIGAECTDAGGRILNNFHCTGFGVCCSLKIEEQSCAAKNGEICSTSEECRGREETSSDGACCVGSCVEIEQPTNCEISGGICASFCGDDEEENGALTCSAGNVCCVEKEATEGSNLWIIILVILIILAALAIIFRHKLQLWWFNFRRKRRNSGGLKPSSPPPGYNSGRALPRRPLPMGYAGPSQRGIPRRALSAKDKELEETLKKLKEMGK